MSLPATLAVPRDGFFVLAAEEKLRTLTRRAWVPQLCARSLSLFRFNAR